METTIYIYIMGYILGYIGMWVVILTLLDVVGCLLGV